MLSKTKKKTCQIILPRLLKSDSDDDEYRQFVLSQVILEQKKLQNYTLIQQIQSRFFKDSDKENNKESKLKKQNTYIQRHRSLLNQTLSDQLLREEERLQNIQTTEAANTTTDSKEEQENFEKF